MNKKIKIEAHIAGVAGSYDENVQRKYCLFFKKDWAILYVHLVLPLNKAVMLI